MNKLEIDVKYQRAGKKEGNLKFNAEAAQKAAQSTSSP